MKTGDVAIATGVSFDLSEDQRAVREMVRDFAEREIRPIAAHIDETHEFPAATTKKMAELGLLGMFVPEQYDGAGMDYLSYVIAIEELSRVCASHGVIASVNNSLVCFPIMTYGTEAQKEKYLKPLARGDWLGAYCLTEPNAGSNAANQETTATADGDDFILNGTKLFVTNAGPSDILVVYAATDRSLGPRGISAFIVEATTPGVTKGKKEKKLGIHGSDTREIAFANARVPKANMLGQLHKGYTVALATLGGGRIGIAAQALGIAQAAVEAAVRYAGERHQFDLPIGEFDAIRAMLADSAVELETSRLLVYQAAWLRDQGRPHIKEASLAKWHASEAATRCAGAAIQVHGGYGYLTEFTVERLWRDAKICEIYEGTTEVQKMVVAAQLLKEHAIGPPG
ncbi:MAG: acyl-CoA dehydrogenase [Candidatus Eisenbacteria bacterium RBG_16_71_46]|nr:MAG: acyl-CoA dehydrogenase [Candidatus Eisenbacteria bacterium RBG_16_71_46]OGF23175.1 MAG: acyl-CoA dehydrogenase [Candidatus Eisenbacteria bacterium RBG_19FT_COMBO_70_11]